MHLKSDTLLSAYVIDNVRKIYELDPSKFISAPGFAWQTVFKKTEVKLELLSEIDILLMVEKGIRGEMCNSIKRYAKANNKYTNIWKVMIKIKNNHL